jgi:hypothetical protein
MSPTIPVNHYSGAETNENGTGVLFRYSMLMYSQPTPALNTIIYSR